MAFIVKSVFNYYNYLTVDMQDPRLENYPLMGSPVPVMMILASYLYFVLNLGPKLMENRKPFELRKTMMIYNIIQVIASFSFACWGLHEMIYKVDYNWTCELANYNDDVKGRHHILQTYLYFSMKILDFMDTIFFILRKRFNQVTFLHVYHHCCVSITTYLCVKYFPGGHVAFIGVLNSFVHAFMYSYYFATIIKPELKSSKGLKKYITQIQMYQFTILCLHFVRPILYQSCKYPKVVSFVALTQNLFLLLLFTDFYMRTYMKKNKNDNNAIKQTKNAIKN